MRQGDIGTQQSKKMYKSFVVLGFFLYPQKNNLVASLYKHIKKPLTKQNMSARLLIGGGVVCILFWFSLRRYLHIPKYICLSEKNFDQIL